VGHLYIYYARGWGERVSKKKRPGARCSGARG
jgi:hypothetical protein